MPVARRKKSVAPAKPQKNGYAYDLYTDGVTQSMIGTWLACREQCRLAYVEGWRSLFPSFPLVYGSAAHWCFAEVYKNPQNDWDKRALAQLVRWYDVLWRKEHRLPSQAELEMHELSLGLLDAVLPHYIDRCSRPDRLYNDFKTRKWVKVEQNFRIPYATGTQVDDNGDPYAVGVPLRGRFDGVFRDKGGLLWLFETKNLSMIDQDGMTSTLPTNFQVMFYLNALRLSFPNERIGGVLYNVVRRPGLRRCVDESLGQFCKRVAEDVAKKPDHYFMRWEVAIPKQEVVEWDRHVLRPILGEMRQWWNHGVKSEKAALDNPFHYPNPFSLITKYGRCSMFNIIAHKNYSGHVVRDVPFSELEEA